VVINLTSVNEEKILAEAKVKEGVPFQTRLWIEECIRKKRLLSPLTVNPTLQPSPWEAPGKDEGEDQKGKQKSQLYPANANQQRVAASVEYRSVRRIGPAIRAPRDNQGPLPSKPQADRKAAPQDLDDEEEGSSRELIGYPGSLVGIWSKWGNNGHRTRKKQLLSPLTVDPILQPSPWEAPGKDEEEDQKGKQGSQLYPANTNQQHIASVEYRFLRRIGPAIPAPRDNQGPSPSKPQADRKAAPRDLDDEEEGSSGESIGYPGSLIGKWGKWGNDGHQFDTVGSDGEDSETSLPRTHQGSSSSAEGEEELSSAEGEDGTPDDDGQTVCHVVLF